MDLSGLELLSNSIEQFVNHHTYRSDALPQDGNSLTSAGVDSSQDPSKLPTCLGSSLSVMKQELSDIRPADEKAAETLQMLCQQSAVNQMKSSVVEGPPVTEHPNTTFNNGESIFSENCDNKVLNITSGQISVGDLNNSSNNNAECGKVWGDTCLNQVCERVETIGRSLTGGSNMLGGLGLLCALAEQRFMEEVATTTDNSASKPESSGLTGDDVHNSSSPGLSVKLLESPPEGAGPGVDVNRNYKTRKSEQECKKYIASKVMQYYHHSGTGNNSGSSSPQHCSQQMLQSQKVISLCSSPSLSSAEIMDAMELNMRMKLAELQRKYREKQRELSKLTPKKSSLSDATSNEVSDAPQSVSPVKRGPGRPRKKCNKLCLDSPPLSPPGGAGLASPKPRVGRAQLLASSRELPPPVLEKVSILNILICHRYHHCHNSVHPLKIMFRFLSIRRCMFVVYTGFRGFISSIIKHLI